MLYRGGEIKKSTYIYLPIKMMETFILIIKRVAMMRCYTLLRSVKLTMYIQKYI